MYPQQNYTPNNPKDYDFIVNPQQAQKRNLLGGSSVAVRIGIVLGAAFLILITFVIIRNVLSSGGSNQTALIAVVSEQKELVRLSTEVLQQGAPVSGKTKNSIITTQVSVASAQSELIKYMAKNGQKVELKKVIHPGKAANDDQLKAALASGTYDLTVSDVLKTQLTSYQADLKTAFNKTSGTVGKDILNRQYKASELLLKQLGPAQ